MDPENKQEISELLQKHVDGGDDINTAKQKVLDEGYDSKAVEAASGSIDQNPTEQPDSGNVAIAENDLLNMSTTARRNQYLKRGAISGVIISGILDFFPWFTVSCTSSFYRSLSFAYPSTCTNMRATGIPLPIRETVTFTQLQLNGQIIQKTENLFVFRAPIGINAFIWGLAGCLVAYLLYKVTNKG